MARCNPSRLSALLSGAAAVIAFPAFAATEDAPSITVEEVIITATRQEEPLSKVPISVAAYTQADLDRRGARSIDDIARITPGVDFRRNTFGSGTGVNIAIRGVRSTVGAATTGLYIDDTPIQARAMGLATSAFPQVFDLARVEVLRGPQGTLFGAGAEGGAVRFITPAPGAKPSVYARSEAALTDGGDPTYEAGFAVGGPLADDHLSGRLSAWTRREGGWVDHMDFFTRRTTDDRSNWNRSSVVRAALAWTPTSNLTISPSVFLQDQRVHDGSSYWLQFSNPDSGDYRNANLLESPARDKFSLTALNVRYDFGGATLVSNTSYFSRLFKSSPDFTQFGGAATIGDPYPFSYRSAAAGRIDDLQQVFTQEVRLQSSSTEGRFNWIVGAFYSNAKQKDVEDLEAGDLEELLLAFYGLTIQQFYGEPLRNGVYVFVQDSLSRDKQLAAFGQIDYRVTDRLKVTLGARLARSEFEFSTFSGGPYNYPDHIVSGSQKETPFTPKLGVSFQADPNNLFYATIAKGYRAGGAQPQVPTSTCRTDLAALGLSQSPASYDSDRVWSYEAGAKNRLAGGRLQLDANAYYIEWSDIQQTVGLPNCHLNFVANLGSATSKGVDFSAQVELGDHFTLTAAVGYVDAQYEQTFRSGSSTIVAKGDRIGGSPWTVALSGTYRRKVLGDHDGYVRLDYDFKGRGPRANPVVSSFDPAIPPHPITKLLNLRAGVKVEAVDVSVFANNLLNSHPQDLTHDALGSPLFYASTLRPRTIGITATYRY